MCKIRSEVKTKNSCKTQQFYETITYLFLDFIRLITLDFEWIKGYTGFYNWIIAKIITPISNQNSFFLNNEFLLYEYLGVIMLIQIIFQVLLMLFFIILKYVLKYDRFHKRFLCYFSIHHGFLKNDWEFPFWKLGYMFLLVISYWLICIFISVNHRKSENTAGLIRENVRVAVIFSLSWPPRRPLEIFRFCHAQRTQPLGTNSRGPVVL